MEKIHLDAVNICWRSEIIEALLNAWNQDVISDEEFITCYDIITQKKEANQK